MHILFKIFKLIIKKLFKMIQVHFPESRPNETTLELFGK